MDDSSEEFQSKDMVRIEFAFTRAWYAAWRAEVLEKLPHSHGITANALETSRRSIFRLLESTRPTTRPPLEQAIRRVRQKGLEFIIHAETCFEGK